MPHPSQQLIELARLAHAAGQKIMEIYASDFHAHAKADASPVTEADVAAEAVILAGLAQLYPDIPVIAEEQVAAGEKVEAGKRFFLVDPLDGTREFISRNGEFTVNIGLVENSVPVAGLVYAPATNALYAGATGVGAFKATVTPSDTLDVAKLFPITARTCPAQGPTILASRSHRDAETEAFIAKQKPSSITNAGSSLKFCLVAEGIADLYPRFGRTMEWDTAAGHAVLLAAGGGMTMVDGMPFTYGKPGFANPAFIARGRS